RRAPPLSRPRAPCRRGAPPRGRRPPPPPAAPPPPAPPPPRPIEEFERVAQIWVKGEARVRHYASPESALADLAELKAQGKAIRAIYAQDRDSGIKLLANQAWFVRDGEGRLNAFLLREQAQDYARRHGGEVRDFAAASQQALALR
ncbi:nitrous oxide reductase accessory protein NosL, partial [Pseudomonas aeruginosa]|nr:nitrous oxide reductase accessory protein NosL [Pseudomonas aeruginosa]